MRVRLDRLARLTVQQLQVASILLITGPLLVVVLVVWQYERARLLATVRDQVDTAASLVAMLERRRYDGARQILAAMAAAPAVRMFDAQRCTAYLKGLQRAFPAYTNLGLVDLEGRIVCAAVAPANNVRVSDRVYFREALRAPAVSAEYVLGRATGLRALTFAARLSLDPGSGTSGVIFAALDLDRAAERLRSLRLPDFLHVDITTQDGIVLATSRADPGVLGRPIGDEALKQRIRSARDVPWPSPADDLGTELRIGAFSPTSIVVVARVDWNRLLAPLTRRLSTQLAVLLLAATLGATLAWRMSHRRIATPITGLLRRMGRFEAGEPDEMPPVAARAVELSQLHDAFTRMHGSLVERALERERLLDDLSRMQAKMVTAQRVSRTGYWELDAPSGQFLETQQLGDALGVVVPQTLDAWLGCLSPADADRLKAAFRSAADGGEAIDVEYEMNLEGRDSIWVRMRGEPDAANGGRERLHGSLQDITQRKVADSRVLAQIGRLQLLHRITRAITDRLSLSEILLIVVAQLEQQMPLAFCAAAPFSSHSNSIAINQVGPRSMAAATRMGLAPGDTMVVDGDGLKRAIHGELVYEPETGDLPAELPKRLSQAGLHAMVLMPLRSASGVSGVIITARATNESFSSLDCEFLRQLGEQVALALHQADLYTALRTSYEALHRSQSAALRQERLRSLGELASGIAHDINNGVSPLVLYIESLLKHETGLSAAGRDKLATMRLAADGIASTVERLRDFHPQEDVGSNAGRSSVNEAVRRVIELTRTRWRDSALQRGALIEVVTDLQADVPDVRVGEAELRDGCTNLVFNAVDALPKGGRLSFRTRAVCDFTGAPMVELCIADNGIGMDEQTRTRCLEPFFTTKEGSGTGLGLAMVQAMTQRCGGHLEIDSAAGSGTTVCIQLPVVGAKADLPARDADPDAGPAVLRLLLVDDDPFVLYPLRGALQDDGHEVVAVEGGREALERFRKELERGAPFDVVVTDLGMPHMDGSQIAREVKALRPSTLVVMLTGWGRRMAHDGGPPPFVDALLSKPPRLAELRTVLAAAGGDMGRDGQ